MDMIALNEFNHTGVVAEIKRNKKKISPNALKTKISHLPADFSAYQLTEEMLSLEDM